MGEIEKVACKICGFSYELTEENFQVNNNNRKGFSTWCKGCTKKYEKTRYKNKIKPKKQREGEHNPWLNGIDEIYM